MSTMVKSDSIHESTCYTDGNENSCGTPEDTTILLQTHAQVHSMPENAESMSENAVASRTLPHPEDEDYKQAKAEVENLSEDILNGVAETLGPRKLAEVLELMEDFQLTYGPLSHQAEALALYESATPSSAAHSISLMAKLFDNLAARTSGHEGVVPKSGSEASKKRIATNIKNARDLCYKECDVHHKYVEALKKTCKAHCFAKFRPR